MDLYELTIPILKRMLRHLDTWIDKGASYARARKFDPEVLVQARLAPDQFALARQIQAACDAAKFAAAKLCGREPPSNPDAEKTLDELHARIRATVAYLDGFAPADFAGSDERPCRHKWMDGRWLRGRDYVERVVLPNFFFHLTTCYAILRHNGVDLGKDDFLGEMPYGSAGGGVTPPPPGPPWIFLRRAGAAKPRLPVLGPAPFGRSDTATKSRAKRYH